MKLHIPDGLLDLKTCAGTATLSTAALGYAFHRARRTFADRRAPVMGVLAASLFAAQMINFPIPGGTSGHLLGGVLAAAMLGPWNGLVVLSVVLAVQCLMFQDGGVTALGANILNVGVIGSIVGYAIYAPIRRVLEGPRGTVTGAVLAAWFTVMLGATACSIQLAVSGTYQLPPTLGVMLLTHSLFGLGEALITGFALAYVVRTRPDLLFSEGQTGPNLLVRSGQVITAGLAIAFVIAIFLSPFASELPDGLEASLARLGIDTSSAEPLLPGLMPDYVPRRLENFRFAGSVAGAVGTAVAFAVACVVSYSLRSKSSTPQTHHAS